LYFGDKRIGLQLHHDSAPYASFFTREYLNKNNMTEAESQAVLNALTEYDSQDALKHCRSTWNGAYIWKWTIWRVMVASRPKVSF
jgi:hypothetical protein